MKIRINLFSALAVALMLVFGTFSAKADGLTITVTPWLAPNAFGSPSWTTAEANAVYAEENGLSTYGAPGPGQFNAQTTPITAAQGVVTGFSSWMGVADPGGAYAGEYGNRMTFAVAIVDVGSTFSISQLSFTGNSSDPGDGLAFSYNAGDYDYSSNYVGVIYNGSNPPTYITSGPNTQQVDALFSRGSGNSYPAYCTSCTPAGDQAAIDAVAASEGAPFTFTGTYSIGNVSGSGAFDVVGPTPEPSSLVLLGTGILGIAGAARKKLLRA